MFFQENTRVYIINNYILLIITIYFAEHKGNLKFIMELINKQINRKEIKSDLPESFKENKEIFYHPTVIANILND